MSPRSPMARVATCSAGGVVVAASVTILGASLAEGMAWWAAVGLAAVMAVLFVVVAIAGFRAEAPRCPRCGQWRELATGAGGQALCSSCWQAIVGEGR